MEAIKTWLTTIATLLCSISVSAYDFEVDGILYDITSEQEVEIVTETESFNGGDVVIPETVIYNGTQYNVVSIGTGAFQGNEDITSVIISKNVTSIGEYAFEWCSNLTSVSILGNITAISRSLFDGCSSLSSITIPEGVTLIASGAFEQCGNLTNITLPESLTEISYGAFNNCSKLTSIIIPQNVKLIQNGAFKGCNALMSLVVATENNTYDSRNNSNAIIETKTNTLIQGCASTTIPNTVTAIGSYAFEDCINLTSLVIPNSVKEIGYQAFQGCSSMTSVNIPTGVTSIYANTFCRCSSLESIIIPFTVTSIGNYAFMGCSSLTSIIIPKSVTEIRQYTFSYCNNLTSIVVESGNAQYDSRNNCNAIIETKTNELIQGCVSTVIPNSITSIGDNAFNGCTRLSSIVIPESVTSIDSGAFQDCIGLTSISLPKNITTIESGTFYGCTSLTSIKLPQDVIAIESSAFGECSSLTSINIPKGVTAFEYDPFYGCTSLKEMKFEDGTENLLLGYDVFEDVPFETVYLGRNLTYKSSTGSGVFYGCETLKRLTIGDDVKEIDWGQFQNCENLESVVIGDGVTEIGDQAFCSCDNLTSVVMGNGVTKIGSSVFSGCVKLEEFDYSSSNVVLESYAFSGCTSLRTFNFDGISNIGNNAFSESGLVSVYLPASLQQLGYPCFANMSDLKSITIAKDFKANLMWGMPNCTAIETITVEEGNTMYDTRDNCNALIRMDSNNTFFIVGTKSSFIPDGVTVIGPFAFMSIPISEIKIPSSVKQILGYAFAGTALKSITCQSVTPPTIDAQVFADVDTSIPVYVPSESVSDYCVASGWSQFTNILPLDEDIVISDQSSEYVNVQNIYDVNVTYTRTFNNTNWQALYVPFEIPVTEEFLADFEVADLNDVRQYDRDDDGVKDETVIEAFKVKSGVLEANYPYLIRAREAGEKTITVTDATLFAAEENSIDCSSVREKFTFTGTYSRLSSNELPQGLGYYALSGGVWQPVAANASLGAFRFYLKVDSRNGVNAAQGNAIRMRIIDENGNDDGTTGIKEIRNHKSEIIYDLQGRRVEHPTKGMYIVNGKKTLIK